MREWIDLCEARVDQTPLWINVRTKQVVSVDDGGDEEEAHHNPYLLKHFREFGLTDADMEPFRGLDYEEMINSTDLREKAILKGWTRVITSNDHGRWLIQIEARNMRALYAATMILMERGVKFLRDSSAFFYDLLQPHRSGHLDGMRLEDFITTGKF